MKPLTMSEQDERIYREPTDGRVYAIDRPALAVNLRAAWSEVDALRAKLAAAEKVVAAVRELSFRPWNPREAAEVLGNALDAYDAQADPSARGNDAGEDDRP